ncbi:MAG: hypothetical protein E7255_13940 [Lachnospiraceae bacterium]|nr:hypothetical protein [Lachnospiraceae bacterium]
MYRTACVLFDELWDGSPILNLGIRTSKLVSNDTARQINLFSMETDEKKGYAGSRH